MGVITAGELIIKQFEKYKPMEKLFFFDLETTGTNFWQHGIHQISGAIVIDGELKEKFNYKVQPNPAAKIEQGALDVANVTKEQIMAYPPMHEVYKEVLKMLGKYVNKFDKRDKFHLVGFNNAQFDNPFFRAWFVQNHDKYFGSWFWADSIDVMVLSSYHFRLKRNTMENFKQATVAKALGIHVDDEKLHDAEYDTELLMQIYAAITA